MIPRKVLGSALAVAILAAAVGLLLHSRERGLVGVYAAEGGSRRLEFEPGGRVYVTSVGGTFVTEYELDGERVILHGAGGSQVLTLAGNSLEGGYGTTYVKVEEE